MLAGAIGYVLKDTPRDELNSGDSNSCFGSTVYESNCRYQTRRTNRGPKVTEHEISVLRHVAAGQANKEIADTLGISEGTVKSHVNNIMQKLGALSRTDAAITGLRKGLIKMLDLGPQQLGQAAARKSLF